MIATFQDFQNFLPYRARYMGLAEDLDAALNSHRRVWLIGQDTVIRSLIPSMRSIVENRFTLQEDGQFVSVYLATQ